MPTYEYECDSCSFRFEKRQSFSAEPVAECPECQGSSHRLFHPAPIIFKGSGFYVTDSRKPGDHGSDGGGGASTSHSGPEKAASKDTTASGKDSGGTKE
ncbi:MAG TPA: zinc ribbon domain-containing protein [Dehalococcoidia bacterium]|nr:zinc ribbon domain-containing protein [Dehalococcoidia bacterium]